MLLRVPQRAATTLATSLVGNTDSPDGLPDIEPASRPGTSGGELVDNARVSNMSVHELNSLRGDEISLKAMSAIVFLLMRWFKASRKLIVDQVDTTGLLTLVFRCTQIRISFATTAGLKLHHIHHEAVHASRIGTDRQLSS